MYTKSYYYINYQNGSIIQSNPYQLMMNLTCTPCKVLCWHSTYLLFNILQYTVLRNECFIHMHILINKVHKVSQSFTKFHKWHYAYTLVARLFTCGIVCLPLFLKVIEKGCMIRAIQVAVGDHIQTWKYTIVLPLYLIFHCITCIQVCSGVETNLRGVLIRALYKWLWSTTFKHESVL